MTGIAAASTFKDSIITSYRDHATHLVRGGTVKEVMGELLGKTCGAAGGVGGSMHMYKKENNFYGGAGIVGAQVPVGAGLALKHKMLGEPNVSFALYGADSYLAVLEGGGRGGIMEVVASAAYCGAFTNASQP